MQKYFGQLTAQFKEFYGNLTPTKRMSLVLSVAIVTAAFFIMMMMAAGRNYTPLFRDVSPDKLASVLASLKEKNIPFKVDNDGKTVLVPPELLHSTQMAIMSESGFEDVGTVGLELFDKEDFGTTNYEQTVKYQRALQGELMRAINTLDVVKQSKVILALPPKKTFLEEGGKPSASVVVDLYPGKTLTDEQIKGVRHLVSSAVENLSTEHVTVLDARGKLLSRSQSNAAAALSSDMLELKQKTESELEEQIESIISRVTGNGKVIARVNAQINFKQIKAVQEEVDPDRTAVRSIQSEEEKLNGSRSNPTGIPGARANLPGAEEAGQVGFRQDVNKELKVTNYEVPKTVRNITEVPGAIEKLSIAVLVDGKTLYDVNEETGETTQNWQALSEEELQKYEALVKNAIGFSAQRGDQISIENIKFANEDFNDSVALLNQLERRKMIRYIFKWTALAFAFALLFFIVVRPFMKWVTDSFQESIDDMLPKTIEELEELQSIDHSLPGMSSAMPMLEEAVDPDKAESELLKERIMGFIDRDEKKAADALSLWLIRRDL